MKRRADLLIDGKYKRITIWDALDWKQNRPKLWEIYKDNIYSICKKPENKVRMVFQTGKNGIVQNSYFRYYNADFAHKGEGSEESYRHEFFKDGSVTTAYKIKTDKYMDYKTYDGVTYYVPDMTTADHVVDFL